MKAYTDIKQSKKLSEILPPESADMWYWEWPTAPKYNNYEHPMFHKGDDIVNVPCWSLAALLSVTRNYCIRFELTLRANKKYNLFAMTDNFVYRGFNEYPDGINNPIDACYEMILKLHELKML